MEATRPHIRCASTAMNAHHSVNVRYDQVGSLSLLKFTVQHVVLFRSATAQQERLMCIMSSTNLSLGPSRFLSYSRSLFIILPNIPSCDASGAEGPLLFIPLARRSLALRASEIRAGIQLREKRLSSNAR